MDKDEAINFERWREEFGHQAAKQAAHCCQDLLGAVVDSLKQELHPPKPRSLLQTITIAALRRVAAKLNLRLEDQDAAQDAAMVDATFTVIEPEPPIAATFYARRERQYGTTEPQKGQRRSRPAAARTRLRASGYRVYRSADDLHHAENE